MGTINSRRTAILDVIDAMGQDERVAFVRRTEFGWNEQLDLTRSRLVSIRLALAQNPFLYRTIGDILEKDKNHRVKALVRSNHGIQGRTTSANRQEPVQLRV